eukprot:CAMPEP_0174915130 /NCGR_PEP_ID=MMETSP1355-20121228/288_1 /TAXON_ID=464990 /ORGANISM="Hemiselmis tepida, Strain CCMP443" /LENGTH=42 /DNA_ID= /DNA_START= /DNA_END= /DNA_ORIENTATION=
MGAPRHDGKLKVACRCCGARGIVPRRPPPLRVSPRRGGKLKV